MTQHIDKLQRRKDELIDEQMDKQITSIYLQVDKHNPGAENYMRTTYASGREVTKDFKDDWHRVTYKEPMRRWVFKKIFNKGDE